MQKLTFLSVLGSSVALLALAGCEPELGPNAGAGNASAALSLEGSLGEVSVDSGHTVRPDVFSDGYGTYINLTAPAADNGAIMGMLFIEGIDLASFEPGTRLSSNVYDYAIEVEAPDGTITEMDEGNAYLDGIGCSGPTEGDWADDEPAESLSLLIDETSDGAMVVEFESEFRSGNLTGNLTF